jgi:dUTP pyrophosphatase
LSHDSNQMSSRDVGVPNLSNPIEHTVQPASIGAAEWVDYPVPNLTLGAGEEMIDFVQFDPDSKRPEYQTPGAAGMDLCASEFKYIYSGQIVLVNTGIMMAIPAGHVGFICPRSGLALKHGVTVLNAPGCIDSDYRAEIKVILINHGPETFHVKPGDRIAQLVIVPILHARLNAVSHLSDTVRGSGGFGSTGR